MNKFAAIVLILSSTVVFGDDLLLDTIQGKAPAAEKAPAQRQIAVPQQQNPLIQRLNVDLTKLNDPFQKLMYAQFEMAEHVPYDVLQWASLFLQGNYTGTSHLWSVIEPQIPEKLIHVSKSAYLYSIWKLSLHQTFLNKWLRLSTDHGYMASNAEKTFEGILPTNFDQWLLDNGLIVNPSQEEAINELDGKNPLAPALKAWVALRKGTKAEGILNSISSSSPFRYQLAETVALAHARKNDLVGVARVLKNHIQPIIEKQHDSKILSQYYMGIGRLLYQAGNLNAAKEYYEKVPATSADYLQAREELAWVLLRQGNIPLLRGEIKTLGSSLFDETFSPDIYVVRAISNLKMCFFEAVEKDFDKFTRTNRYWAKTIDEAIGSSQTPKPLKMDYFSNRSFEVLKKLADEQAKLAQLGKESIGAALPAVGIQKHWREAQKEIQGLVELAKKNQDQEFRRQWKNQRIILSEAIRKMRFIKVEFLNEVHQLTENKIDRGSLVADQGNVIPAASLSKNKEEIVFPLDAEPWPDELFKLRSTAQSRCLKSRGEK